MAVTKNWLIGAFRQRVNEANELLTDIKGDDLGGLNKKFGGILSDETVTTKKGFFRKSTKGMTKAELEMMIDILEDFINSIDDVKKSNDDLKEMARRLGVDQKDAGKVLALMQYVEAQLQAGSYDSYQIRDIINARVKSGQSFSKIIADFKSAVKNSHHDIAMFTTLFSDYGNLI